MLGRQQFAGSLSGKIAALVNEMRLIVKSSRQSRLQISTTLFQQEAPHYVMKTGHALKSFWGQPGRSIE